MKYSDLVIVIHFKFYKQFRSFSSDNLEKICNLPTKCSHGELSQSHMNEVLTLGLGCVVVVVVEAGRGREGRGTNQRTQT